MLNVKDLDLPGIKLLTPTRFEDQRGNFCETFNQRRFSEAVGAHTEFVQDNESLSRSIGTIRGLHFQLPAEPQAKLVRVIAGRVLDVVVDIRAGSDTFGDHLAVELDGVAGRQLWVPEGFAHGFCTLEANTVVGYKVTGFFRSDLDTGLLWSDPALAIDWPVALDTAVLSDKDARAPGLAELKEQSRVFP